MSWFPEAPPVSPRGGEGGNQGEFLLRALCASAANDKWGQVNFEERGRAFKGLVSTLPDG